MITATDVFEFFMCPYKTYNKFNRDKSLMLPLSEFSKKLMEIGREHEKEMVSHLKVSRPKYNYWDFEKGFEETLKLMKSGDDIIYQGLLKDKNYVGLPDLLFKRKGKSKLGNFYYTHPQLVTIHESPVTDLMIASNKLPYNSSYSSQRLPVFLYR